MNYNPKGKTIAEIVSTPEGLEWLETVDFARLVKTDNGYVYVGAGGYTLPCTGQVVDNEAEMPK